MKEYIDDYLRQGKAEGWSDSTSKNYLTMLGVLSKWLKRPLPDITPADLDRVLLRAANAGWKYASRRKLASVARGFFAWTYQRGKVLSNPARCLKAPRADEEELPPPPLSIEEVGTILDGLPKQNVLDLRNRAMLELMYGCGLRLTELILLDLSNIDLTHRVLHIRKGKGNRERDLPLGRGALHAMRDYQALRRTLLAGPDTGALFLRHGGKRIQDATVRVIVGKLNPRTKRKRRIHPHLFRHSIAVHLLQNGADIRYVQQFLGHQKLDTTKIYLRLVPGRLKEDYEKAMPEIAVIA